MMNNFQLPVFLQNGNQSMTTINRISLVSPLPKRCQKLHIFQLINVEKLQNTQMVQQAEERTKRKLDLLEPSFELENQKILDEEPETKNNADLVVLDFKIDELNRSKFESSCEKERGNIEQKPLKNDSLDVNTLKLKENLEGQKVIYQKRLKNLHRSLIKVTLK